MQRYGRKNGNKFNVYFEFIFVFIFSALIIQKLF